VLDPDWSRRAACADKPTTLFFPENGVYPYAAKAICRDCEVIAECREANPAPGRYGVFWNTTPEERRRLGHRDA